MAKFSDITARAEEVRTRLGLTKSRFAASIGMKPQTYNNFVGGQGSKPNMELFYGIVREFNVDPLWLLSGTGVPFTNSAYPMSGPQATPESAKAQSRPRGERNHDAATLWALKNELDVVLASYRSGIPMLNRRGFRNPQVEHAIEVILHNFWIAPYETSVQCMQMLEEFRRIVEDLRWIATQKSALEERS